MTQSAKETAFFKKFNEDLEYLSKLYDRVLHKGKEEQQGGRLELYEYRRGKAREDNVDKEFYKFLLRRSRKSRKGNAADSDDSGYEVYFNRTQYSRWHRMQMKETWREKERTEIKKKMTEDPEKRISELLDSFNNITEETSQLIEVKDIIDELNMISEVQKEQLKIVRKFNRALKQNRKSLQLPIPLEHQKRLCDEIAVLSIKAGETLTAARITFMF